MFITVKDFSLSHRGRLWGGGGVPGRGGRQVGAAGRAAAQPGARLAPHQRHAGKAGGGDHGPAAGLHCKGGHKKVEPCSLFNT